MHPECGKSMRISTQILSTQQIGGDEHGRSDHHEGRSPDATFIQEIDGRPYHVRVFFPEGTAATLQEKIEQMLRMEMMRTADEGAG